MWKKLFLNELLIFTIPLFGALAWWFLSVFYLGSHKEIASGEDVSAMESATGEATDFPSIAHEIHAESLTTMAHEGTIEAHITWGELIGLGMVPFSIWASLLLFIYGWLGIAFFFGIEHWAGISGWQGALLSFFPSLIGSPLVTGLVVRPLRPFYRDFGKASPARSLIGKIAILDTASISPQFGGAVVKIPGKGDYNINVRTYQNIEGLKRGDTLLILEYNPENNLFYVEPFDNELPS
jgi:hypothetical protein